MTGTFVDIHVLQTVPPSNLNRDDTGSPKTAFYGGVNRARVSSQAWKRAIRTDFESFLDRSDLGVRTKRVVELVADRIRAHGGEPVDADALAEQVLTAAGLKLDKPKPSKGREEGIGSAEAKYLVFLSRHQADRLAQVAREAAEQGIRPDGKAAKAAFDQAHGVDVALFGRMVADSGDLTVDASVQVAHALSVHGVTNEYDYFTAVDDLKGDGDDAGAGMIGTVEFNSSTLYRYATINIDGLMANLGDAQATAQAATAFLQSFVRSMPTGKQNTFANRTLPAGVAVVVRSEQPINLVGAFEDPVQASPGTSRASEAAQRLAAYAAEVDQAYSQAPAAAFTLGTGAVGQALEALGARVTLDELLGRVKSTVLDRLAEA